MGLFLDHISINLGMIKMKQWYEELFTNYANKYENEVYTQGTLGEVDFIEKEKLSRLSIYTKNSLKGCKYKSYLFNNAKHS